MRKICQKKPTIRMQNITQMHFPNDENIFQPYERVLMY